VTFLAAVSGTASSAAGTVAAASPPNDVQAGVLGFLVVASIGVVLVFLLRSMNKHLKKIGPKPEEPAEVLAEETLAGQVVAGEVVAGPGAGADRNARPTADAKSSGD
jgi:hypothetical protein